MPEHALLHYRRDGRPVRSDSDDAARTPVLLGPALGTSMRLWEQVVPALAVDRAVVRYDLPGHGGTPASVLPTVKPGAVTVADLARSVLDLADALGIERFDYAGVSLGGAIGIWLAVHHPQRLSSLAIVCSAARFGDPQYWAQRAKTVREQGIGPIAGLASGRWFTARFAASGLRQTGTLLDDLRRVDAGTYAACCDALAGFDLRDRLAEIAAPTLVIAGREDVSTPVACARELADGIPAASLLEVADTAHLAPVEQPRIIGEALRSHLAVTSPSTDSDSNMDAIVGAAGRAGMHAAGMAVRRAVLGDEHVDRAVANTTAFTADFQDFIARYAWGEIWTRPGLDRRMRSAVTLTALVAGGHFGELAIHVRGALNNGLTRDEVGEILLQTAVYCGVPAANAAFATAQRVFAELGALDEKPGPAAPAASAEAAAPAGAPADAVCRDNADG